MRKLYQIDLLTKHRSGFEVNDPEQEWSHSLSCRKLRIIKTDAGELSVLARVDCTRWIGAKEEHKSFRAASHVSNPVSKLERNLAHVPRPPFAMAEITMRDLATRPRQMRAALDGWGVCVNVCVCGGMLTDPEGSLGLTSEPQIHKNACVRTLTRTDAGIHTGVNVPAPLPQGSRGIVDG